MIPTQRASNVGNIPMAWCPHDTKENRGSQIARLDRDVETGLTKMLHVWKVAMHYVEQHKVLIIFGSNFIILFGNQQYMYIHTLSISLCSSVCPSVCLVSVSWCPSLLSLLHSFLPATSWNNVSIFPSLLPSLPISFFLLSFHLSSFFISVSVSSFSISLSFSSGYLLYLFPHSLSPSLPCLWCTVLPAVLFKSFHLPFPFLFPLPLSSLSFSSLHSPPHLQLTHHRHTCMHMHTHTRRHTHHIYACLV